MKNQVKKSSPRATSPVNTLKWALASFILVGAIVANIYYAQYPSAVRLAVGIIVFAVILWVSYGTTQGKKAAGFLLAARAEIRKVIWPSRQETIRTTILVISMVTFMALVLWGVDTLFLVLVGKVMQ